MKIGSLFVRKRFFQTIGILVLIFLLSHFLDISLWVPRVLFFIFSALLLGDLLLLFLPGKPVLARRFTPEKLSNGDENPIRLYIENFYSFPVDISIIDEIPFQFQRRDISFEASLKPRESKVIEYHLRPVKRGEYDFGRINVFSSSQIGLVQRKSVFDAAAIVPVYPSYLQMRKYEIMAFTNRLVDLGIKKIRRIGHNMEFEQIRDYVLGDDIRTINWKATARRGDLMVNNYQDEKSQQVYCLIDKGRTMQMPFEGMSLLDYAINASLVISNIAINKDDQAGLITFQHRVNTVLPASRRNKQMKLILETLYNQKTAYKESDYSALYTRVRRDVTRRSLLLLFTNFESLSSMKRQLPYLRQMAKSHLVVTIFFENTEMRSILNRKAYKTKDIYNKAIAEKLAYEKKLIVRELQSYGIHAILTSPQALTVNTINKYLELKARGLI
ncbi:DUF58 domain-containing protein [Fulvivirga sedimenti]|uniref:DUF58 domain-containing protein n=1 Tax=Fulvivirga sedimenti TaxID=2879465 RepID=A0A9X1HLC0_9BACT|nr:DUF58 domain-containing protein [Fulvivirga sedimenti]MCA6074364.1 DUF58 domain-containing protein [Fulvivirga sedimenti]